MIKNKTKKQQLQYPSSHTDNTAVNIDIVCIWIFVATATGNYFFSFFWSAIVKRVFM